MGRGWRWLVGEGWRTRVTFCTAPTSAKEALKELAARLLMNCVRVVGPEAAGGDILGRGTREAC